MSAAVYEKQGSSLIVRPEGRLDTASSPMLEEEMKPYLDGVKDLTMDFTDVEYISSGGLRMLLATEKQLKDCGGSMKLIHVNEFVMEVFDMVGFLDVVTVIRE